MSAWEATEELWEQFGMPDRGLPKLAAELAVKSPTRMSPFEVYYFSGDFGDCPDCAARWEDGVMSHSQNCGYLRWLDHCAAFEDNDE